MPAGREEVRRRETTSAWSAWCSSTPRAWSGPSDRSAPGTDGRPPQSPPAASSTRMAPPPTGSPDSTPCSGSRRSRAGPPGGSRSPRRARRSPTRPSIHRERTPVIEGVAAARADTPPGRALRPEERIDVAMEVVDGLSRELFLNAHATIHATGRAFMMAFAGSEPPLDRGLEALSMAALATRQLPETSTIVRHLGRSELVTLDERFHAVGRGGRLRHLPGLERAPRHLRQRGGGAPRAWASTFPIRRPSTTPQPAATCTSRGSTLRGPRASPTWCS